MAFIIFGVVFGGCFLSVLSLILTVCVETSEPIREQMEMRRKTRRKIQKTLLSSNPRRILPQSLSPNENLSPSPSPSLSLSIPIPSKLKPLTETSPTSPHDSVRRNIDNAILPTQDARDIELENELLDFPLSPDFYATAEAQRLFTTSRSNNSVPPVGLASYVGGENNTSPPKGLLDTTRNRGIIPTPPDASVSHGSRINYSTPDPGGNYSTPSLGGSTGGNSGHLMHSQRDAMLAKMTMDELWERKRELEREVREWEESFRSQNSGIPPSFRDKMRNTAVFQRYHLLSKTASEMERRKSETWREQILMDDHISRHNIQLDRSAEILAEVAEFITTNQFDSDTGMKVAQSSLTPSQLSSLSLSLHTYFLHLKSLIYVWRERFREKEGRDPDNIDREAIREWYRWTRKLKELHRDISKLRNERMKPMKSQS